MFRKGIPVMLSRFPPLFLFACLAVLLVGCQQEKPKKAAAGTPAEVAQTDEQEGVFVEQGTETQAFRYYKETFDELELNPDHLENQALVDSQDLAKALQFLGYPTLTSAELEDLPSAELMARFPNQLLSSAFFAPKITDVSPTLTGAPLNPGWRKLIRLTASQNSRAENKGIDGG